MGINLCNLAINDYFCNDVRKGNLSMDTLVKQYLEKVAKPIGDSEFRKYSEIMSSYYSCGIEGSSFSIDDTRALFEQSLGYYPIGKTLLECQEMVDHFKVYEYMHD